MITFGVYEFAARRRVRQERLDEELEPVVKAALAADDYTHLMQEVERVWQALFEEESSLPAPDMPKGLRTSIEANLNKTKDPTEATQATVDRITIWLGTVLLNTATIAAAQADEDDLFLEWVTMRDSEVRHAHKLTGGQQRPIGEPFNVDGTEMRYPGDTSVPIELWINCRCVLRPVLAEEALVAAVEARDVPTAERKKDAKAGRAMPDGSYPIDNCSDLRNAIQAIGRAKNPGPVKSHIKRRKSSLGCPDVSIPEGWSNEEDTTMSTATEVEPEVGTWEGPVPWHGILAPEGVPSGDGRTFAPDSLTNRDLPLPLTWQKVSDDGHKGSVTVASIDTLERINGMMHASGQFLQTAEADEVVGLLAAFGKFGVSVDADDAEMQVDEDTGAMTFTKARIASASIVAIPAFAEAWVSLGTWDEDTTLAGLPPEIEDAEEEPEVDVCDEESADYDEAACEEKKATEADKPPAEGPPFAYNGDPTTKAFVKTEDGGFGTLGTWNVVSRSPSTTSTNGQPTTSAGSGRGTGTAPATDGSRSVVARLVDRTESQPTASSTNVGLVPSPTASSSTTSAGTGGVSTPSISNPSPSRPTTSAETARTDAAASAARGSTTSPDLTAGTSGLSMEFADGHVAPVISMDAVSGTARLSDGTVLVRKFGPTSKPGTMDGPGWLTHPVDTDRLRDYWVSGEGAAKIGWGVAGDFDRCRAQLAKYVKPQYLNGYCANRHYDALGFWPGRPVAGDVETMEAPAAALSLVASTAAVAPAALFANPQFTEGDGRMIQDIDGTWGCPMRIDGDHIFGHLAKWGVCHTGFNGVCTVAPHSATGYAYFLNGEVVTDEGPVPVGGISVGGGHAAGRLGLRPAAAHYDSTSAIVADITCGEDEFGIWYSGQIRPHATEAQIHDLRAAGALSGDWREFRGQTTELVAALAVNSPGFQTPRIGVAAGLQVSLVAAGVVEGVSNYVQEPVDQARLDKLAAFADKALKTRLAGAVARVKV